MKYKYSINDEVYWTDPSGESSGIYKIVGQLSNDGKNSIYLINNGFTEAEVYQHELK
jgi:hypothetical protein